MFWIYITTILGMMLEGIPSWRIAFGSLFLIMAEFILKVKIESCWRLFRRLKPTSRKILKLKFKFDVWNEYYTVYFQFLLIYYCGHKFGALYIFIISVFRIQMHLFKKVVRKRRSIENDLKSLSISNNNNNSNQIKNNSKFLFQFFEFERPLWKWYHYVLLTGCILSWIGSLVFGFLKNLDWCPMSVFFTFIFWRVFQKL